MKPKMTNNKAPIKALDLIMGKTNKVLREDEKKELQILYDIVKLTLEERCR